MLKHRNLVAYYPLESGTFADVSGNGYGGTITGTPTAAAQRFGKGLTFDQSGGTKQFADLNSTSPWAAFTVDSSPVTLAAWCKPDFSGNDGYTHPIIEFSNASVRKGFRMFLDAVGGGGWGMQVMDASTRYYSASTIVHTQNVWTHVAFTWDGTNMRLYLDGLLRQTVTIGGANWTKDATTPTAHVARQGNNTTDSNKWRGVLDELMVFNKCLPLSDIKRIMLGKQPLSV